MGSWFQAVVDRDATESEAERLGASICDWLVEEGIVSSQRSDCVLGSDSGYPPGPNYHKATEEPYDHLFELVTNGLDIVTGGHVFHSGQGGYELICSACAVRQKPNDAWTDAANEWYHGKGPGLLACVDCGNSRTIDEWQHEPPWGFGYLGFEFWNWPPLADEFVQRIARRLNHRVVLVAGKL